MAMPPQPDAAALVLDAAQATYGAVRRGHGVFLTLACTKREASLPGATEQGAQGGRAVLPSRSESLEGAKHQSLAARFPAGTKVRARC